MWYNIILTIGIVILVFSLNMLKKSMSFLKNSERAEGTVIEMKAVRGDESTMYKPIFKFKTNLGKEIIYEHSTSSKPPAWEVGETTTIAYDPLNPEKPRLLTYFGVFSWTIILLSIAMPLIVIGGGYHLAKFFLK
ncbi:MAG: DUF3592 domain-containing protein [Chitinophagaceae bacterium]